jgi:hypothetical protein
MNNQRLKIEEGTINFWIKENMVDYSDNKTIPLVSIDPDGGSIFILKDSDNKIKAFFVVLNRGRIDLEFDVSREDAKRKHMVTFTWSLKDKEVKLYFDNKVMASKSITF